jgi:hypothetical protein
LAERLKQEAARASHFERAFQCLLVAVLAGLGCGGGSGSGGGSCGAPACGGDVVGRWVVNSGCVDRAALTQRVLGSKASCSGAALSEVTPMPYGEITFAADSTYTISLSMDLILRIEFPRSCLSEASCSAVETGAFLTNLIGNSGVGAIACGGTESCSCNESGMLNFGQPRGTQDSSGTYTLSGTTLSLTSTTGVTDSGSYCVQGSDLHLALSGMSSATSATPSNLVFTKS